MRYYLIVILDDNGDYIFRLDTAHSFAELISINKNNLNDIIEITELSKGD